MTINLKNFNEIETAAHKAGFENAVYNAWINAQDTLQEQGEIGADNESELLNNYALSSLEDVLAYADGDEITREELAFFRHIGFRW